MCSGLMEETLKGVTVGCGGLEIVAEDEATTDERLVPQISVEVPLP